MDRGGLVAESGGDTGVIGGLLDIDALDKRTREFRRYSAVLGALYSDLGGEAHLSEVQKQLARRFATLALWCDIQDATALAGGKLDPDLYGRVAGHARRIAETLGVKRVARDVTPRLSDYLRKSAEAAA
jgi:hypothetical protein